MTDRRPKYVVGDRPVNRRTAARLAPAAPAPLPAATTQKLRLVQARNRIGPPLEEQLGAARRIGVQKVSARTVAGGMVAACGGLGLFFAWLHGSVPAAGVAAAALLAGGWLARPAAGIPLEVDAGPVLDPAAVRAFDDMLEKIAPELSPGIAQALADCKDLMLRIARHPAALGVDEHFRLEDRLFVNECLRRYLPDSLQAWFSLPPQQRDQAVAGSESPERLLLAQLELLRGQLEQREAALGRSAAEALLRQERFLRAKAGERRRS